ncbi:MAG: DUF2796 domain-containing protein [Chloroflexi bacterium]|nr:DUF2796 domain-containing protein [Chloroflexota bacterium]
MFRYVLLIALLLIFTIACTSPASQPQLITAQETHEEHSDEAEDEHEHEEEHNDDYEAGHEDEGDHREHEAHEHGAAELMIAWSGNDLAVDLETPTYNVLGFEYAPTIEAEQTLLAESVAALETGEILQFSPDANCTLTSATVETELAEEIHEEDAHEEGETGHEDEEETHSDIDVAYNIQCEHPDKLESLDLSKLFAQFPNFEDLRAQWVSDATQSAKTLTPDDPILSFN